jgi:AraC family transcriptional regulator
MSAQFLETSKISPNVIHCHMFPEDFGFTMLRFPKLSVRRTYDYELELILSDGGIMMLDGKAYPMKRGAVFFRRPGEYTNGRDPFHACSVIIDMASSFTQGGHVYGADYYTMQKKPQENYSNPILNAILPCTYVDNVDRIIYLFERIQEEFREHNAATPLLLRSYALQILSYLYNHAIAIDKSKDQVHKKYHKSVHRSIQYIHAHLAESLYVSDLAKMANLNPDYYSRVFCSCTGLTPSRYILETRLKKARDLIIYTIMPIQKISQQCGFQSLTYFTFRFRELYGLAPSVYRRQFE